MKTAENTVRVWDPVVRYGHWVLVVAFFTAYFTEDDLLTVHVWSGYVVGLVVALRVLWGFVGPRHARFTDFVRSPAATLRYVRDFVSGRPRHYLGHNPAGGAMIVALLLSLSVTVVSGLVLYAIEEGAGPLATWVSDRDAPTGSRLPVRDVHADDRRRGRHETSSGEDAEELWEEIHEVFANLTMFLVGVHVAGVALSSFRHRENLVKAMITGNKRRAPE